MSLRGGAPRLSVVMPAYNHDQYVGAAIQSILDQTYGDFELIVVDDEATDRSVEAVAHFARLDPRVILVGVRHGGLVLATNAGLALARGEYIAIHDDDDISLPQRFVAQVAFLDAHPEVGVVGTGMERFGTVNDAPTFPCDHDAIKGQFMVGRYVMLNGSMMGRREVWDKVGGYRPQFLTSADVDFVLRVSEVTQIANLPTTLYRYRKHEGADTARTREFLQLYARLAVECAHQREEIGRDIFLDGWGGVRRDDTSPLQSTLMHRDGEETMVSARPVSARTLARSSSLMSAHRL